MSNEAKVPTAAEIASAKLTATLNESHAILAQIAASCAARNGEYDMCGTPQTEQERFYGNVNHFADQHAGELNLGVSVVRFEFWKFLFCSGPGQLIVIGLMLLAAYLFGSNVMEWAVASYMTLLIPVLIVFTVVVVIVGAIMGASGKPTNSRATYDGEPLYDTQTGEPLYTNRKGGLFYFWVVVVTIGLCFVYVWMVS
jgi:hypothetical protein